MQSFFILIFWHYCGPSPAEGHIYITKAQIHGKTLVEGMRRSWKSYLWTLLPTPSSYIWAKIIPRHSTQFNSRQRVTSDHVCCWMFIACVSLRLAAKRARRTRCRGAEGRTTHQCRLTKKKYAAQGTTYRDENLRVTCQKRIYALCEEWSMF